MCKQKGAFHEINHKLGSDHQRFFRTPLELLNELVGSVKKVVEYQQFHRTRLYKQRDTHVSLFVRQLLIVHLMHLELSRHEAHQRGAESTREVQGD